MIENSSPQSPDHHHATDRVVIPLGRTSQSGGLPSTHHLDNTGDQATGGSSSLESHDDEEMRRSRKRRPDQFPVSTQTIQPEHTIPKVEATANFIFKGIDDVRGVETAARHQSAFDRYNRAEKVSIKPIHPAPKLNLDHRLTFSFQNSRFRLHLFSLQFLHLFNLTPP